MPNKTWMTDQRLHQIDPHKLDFLQKLVFEMQELSDGTCHKYQKASR